MMKNFESTPRFFMTYEHPFDGIRFFEGKLQPTKWKLTVNMSGPEITDDNGEEQSRRSSMMYQKLLFWMESVLHDCIVTGIVSLNEVGGFQNATVVLPDHEPSDDVLLQTLHSKLATIAGKDMIIGQMSIYSSDTNITYHFNHDGVYDLPSQEDFIGDNALHPTPWWSRADCDTFDVNDDHENREGILQSGKILDDFSTQLERAFFGEEEDPESPADIIEIDQWQKPRKV